MGIHKIKPLKLNEDISVSIDTTNLGAVDYGALPAITMSDLTLGNIAFSNGTSTTYTLGQGANANAVWTTSGTGYNWQSAVGTTITPSATISLKGEDADIDLNGKSMKAWMEKVEDRLNLLTANPGLEEEWDELRELGEKYRELEKKCKEKAEAWKKLKSMPPLTQD